MHHKKVWKCFKRLEYQTTLPASWETCMQVKKQVRTGYGTMDWFKTGKGIHQACILPPCLFNLYAEYIMQNTWMDQDCQEKYQLSQISRWHHPNRASWVVLMIKNTAANAGDIRDDGLNPGLWRSPRVRHGNPLQCSCHFGHLLGSTDSLEKT